MDRGYLKRKGFHIECRRPSPTVANVTLESLPHTTSVRSPSLTTSLLLPYFQRKANRPSASALVLLCVIREKRNLQICLDTGHEIPNKNEKKVAIILGTEKEVRHRNKFSFLHLHLHKRHCCCSEKRH
jgi:hypothetical protein